MEGIGLPPTMDDDYYDPTTVAMDEVTSQTDSDGMLDQENAELRDRVIALEKKVQQQDDEILCLKGALSDAIRRISTLESGRSAQNSMLPNKPAIKSQSRRTGAMRVTRESTPSILTTPADCSPRSQRVPSPVPNRVVPRGPVTNSAGSLKRWPSTPSTATSDNVNVSPLGPTRRSGSMSSLSGRSSPLPIRHKEPTYNSDDVCLKFYLRGKSLNFYGPSNLEDYQMNQQVPAPTEKLQLEWVYGYRGRDARSNLYLLPTGEMVYFIASVVVLYNVEEQMQRHYLGHTDDVKCLAVHPDKITIATGQVAGHDKREGRRTSVVSTEANDLWPHVRIWNSVNLATLRVLGIGDFDRAVSCLAFSKADGGQFLAAVDDANEHVISLWEWQKADKGHKVTETKSSTEPVLAVEFHPCESNVVVTCGKGHLAFWNIDGGTLTRKQGIFEKHDKPKFVTCLAFAENGDVLTGDSNGNLFVWSRGTNRITHAMTGAHEGGIFSICVMKDGTILTGGKDRHIQQWDTNYKKKASSHREIPDHFGSIRMLTQGKGNMVLVGTTKNAILQGSLDLEFSTVVQGHTDELWGMAAHPNQHQFLTCGYDKNVYLWDTMTHTAVWSTDLPDGAHSACFYPEGTVVVVGTLPGRWIVLDVTTHDIISSHTDGNEPLECVEFSTDGKSLAVGSRDNTIYVYAVSDSGKKYSRIGKCSGHSSFITHLDWSSDGQYLRSNSGDYEILFWNATTCRQVPSPSSMRDVEWATHNCTLAFTSCGIWPEAADGTDVNACTRSNKQHLLASADDFGKVNLYKYPSFTPRSAGHICHGHSSHVTNVRFLHDDSRLLSTGGKDTAILQWEVVDDAHR